MALIDRIKAAGQGLKIKSKVKEHHRRALNDQMDLHEGSPTSWSRMSKKEKASFRQGRRNTVKRTLYNERENKVLKGITAASLGTAGGVGLYRLLKKKDKKKEE